MRPACVLVLAAVFCGKALYADEQIERMKARLSEEAEAFLKLAPQVIGTEALRQQAVKPPSRFRPRVGNAVNTPPPKQWNKREIVSEYGFTSFGEAGDIHELRRVVSVDGKQVEESSKAQEALAKTITSTDDARKRQLLKDFEKHGLIGAVTDFGQMILLFTRRELEKYEFRTLGSRMIGRDRALVFAYKQIDGPEGLTVFDSKKDDKVKKLKIEGEIRVRAEDFLPLQITMIVRDGDGKAALTEEAAVDYAMSPFGALLPVSTDHRERHGEEVAAENAFRYSDFHRFGASSDIKFEVEK